MAENVKVAVRVRPFNAREKARNATLIIDMHGNSTTIKDPDDENAPPKVFAFDYSYWSHDGFTEREDGYYIPADDRYTDQSKVFEDVGRGVMHNAWEGFNCSLFAYGQTGAGKSYSVMGYGVNRGIVPIFCDQLFVDIEKKRETAEKDEDYAVMFSMIEIYNEQCRDLLNPQTMSIKGGLKLRQHPKLGFVVDNLTTANVNNFKEIDNKMNDGNKNRTIAATNMNATSSRAHTIISLIFNQKKPNESGQSMTKQAVINLVDLAGSERAESTGATGDRLKEGSAINQSLSSLGNVIKALADQANFPKKKIVVPYRDSTLTKLLMNALGGNSKTIMVAAVSPADINYSESLSTLRFADRAKSIKTNATINESPTDKLIRELREENKKMMEMLKKAGVLEGGPELEGGGGSGASSEEIEAMKKQMEEALKKKEEELANLSRTYEERMQAAAQSTQQEELIHRKEEDQRKTVPHFWNLNEDPALDGMIVHFIKDGVSKVGNKNATPPPEIQLNGLSIGKDHAVISNTNGKITLAPGLEGRAIMVNGQKIEAEFLLSHNDRVSFGPNHLFVFHHPQEHDKLVAAGEQITVPTFDTAQEEIAKSSGLMAQAEGQSKEDLLLQEDLIHLLPMISEANAMAEELRKQVKFETLLLSPQARGLKSGRTEVMVKMLLQDGTGNDYLWDRNKFINRKYIMQEMYQNYVEKDPDWDLPPEKDPFWEPPDMEKLIGTTNLFLQSLAYNIELAENLSIADHKGADQGNLEVEIIPCDSEYRPVGEDDFVEDPKELIGKPFFCKILIKSAHGLPMNIDRSFCRYRFYLDHEYTQTEEIAGTINPTFDHEKKIAVQPATNRFIDYLNNESLHIEVWGRQKLKKQRRHSVGAGTVVPRRRMMGSSLAPIDGQMREEIENYQKQVAVNEKEIRYYKQKLEEQNNHVHKVKEQVAEVNKKWNSMVEYLKKLKTEGRDAMMVEDFEALLKGEDPPGKPVEQQSAFCSIQ